ncbi:MAG: hypothetical protein MZV65_39430 [Chromatiales bacterium]|nr:hypothetical protein [Chromatiales bacterium]
MKLLIHNTQIIGTALDEYSGPEQFIVAPDDFDPAQLNRYRLIDGELRVSVPQVVSRFQGRAAMHLAGVLSEVEAPITTPETPALTKMAWADAQEFQRDSPSIAAIAEALEWSEAFVDELFITAGGITA